MYAFIDCNKIKLTFFMIIIKSFFSTKLLYIWYFRTENKSDKKALGQNVAVHFRVQNEALVTIDIRNCM